MKNWHNKFQQLGLITASSFFLLNGGVVKANVLVPPSPFKGLNVVNFDQTGQLYVGSLTGQTIHSVDIETGDFEIFIDRPQGEVDDFFFNSRGQIFYTALLSGEVRTFDPKTGDFNVIASGLPGVNPIIQNEDSRIFVAQSLTSQGNSNALYEIDPEGQLPPRFIRNNPGVLNAFDFGSDGLLYAPTWLGGTIVKIDVDTGISETVASGLLNPTSVKFNSQGELFAADTADGRIVRVNPSTQEIEVVVSLPAGIDNMAFSPNDLLYVSSLVDNTVYEVNTETSSVRKVIESEGLSSPGGIAVFDNGLYVADTYAYRVLDRETGLIEQTLPNFATPIQFPLNLSVNDSHVVTSSWFAGIVQRLDRHTSSVLNNYTGFGLPYDAVELSDGSILVADCALGQVTQILDEADTNRKVAANNLSCPTGLAVLDDTTVLVTEFLANRLSLIDVITGNVQIIATDLLRPEGVAYHPDGFAIVAETETQSLRAIDLKTGKTKSLGSNLPIGLPGFIGGPPPYSTTGVAIFDDTVYVTGDLDNSIRTVTLPSNLFETVPEKHSPLSLLVLVISGLSLTFKQKLKK